MTPVKVEIVPKTRFLGNFICLYSYVSISELL